MISFSCSGKKTHSLGGVNFPITKWDSENNGKTATWWSINTQTNGIHPRPVQPSGMVNTGHCLCTLVVTNSHNAVMYNRLMRGNYSISINLWSGIPPVLPYFSSSPCLYSSTKKKLKKKSDLHLGNVLCNLVSSQIRETRNGWNVFREKWHPFNIVISIFLDEDYTFKTVWTPWRWVWC